MLMLKVNGKLGGVNQRWPRRILQPTVYSYTESDCNHVSVDKYGIDLLIEEY
jgi:hypothetical protein